MWRPPPVSLQELPEQRSPDSGSGTVFQSHAPCSSALWLPRSAVCASQYMHTYTHTCTPAHTHLHGTLPPSVACLTLQTGWKRLRPHSVCLRKALWLLDMQIQPGLHSFQSLILTFKFSSQRHLTPWGITSGFVRREVMG